MSDRVKVANLRTMPASELEIYLADVLKKPLDQVAPETVADALALAEVETLPRPLHRALKAFADRVASEVQDVPAGPPFTALLAELEGLNGAHVPDSLRGMIAKEIENLDRDSEERGAAAALVGRWAAVTFQPAEPGKNATLPMPVKKVPPVITDEDDEPVRKSSRTKGPAPRRRALLDEPKGEFVRESALGRLARHPDGLLEAVLVAGVCHHAREGEFTDLQRHEVLAVLRALKEIGHVAHSAGRWKRTLPY